MKSNGVAPFYVKCSACGIVAPPRSVRRPNAASGGADTTVIECAGCGEFARIENLKVAHSNHAFKCARRRCRTHFLVPRTAHLVCCTRCAMWQDGPAAAQHPTAAHS
jgi:hypothetical protein